MRGEQSDQSGLEAASGAVGGPGRGPDPQAAVLRPGVLRPGERVVLATRVADGVPSRGDPRSPATSSSTRSSTSRSSSCAIDDIDVSAYYNSCRHRGMKLVEGSGSRRSFVCPFHGWCWGLDGKNTFVLRAEEFDERQSVRRRPRAHVRSGANCGVAARGSTSTTTRRRCVTALEPFAVQTRRMESRSAAH